MCFIGKDLIALLYVDDYIIFYRMNSDIFDKLIQSLKDCKENFEFTDEGDLNSYLGVDITKQKYGSIEVNQPRLIGRFIALADQDQDQEQNININTNININIKTTPVTKTLLNKDADGLERKHS